MPFGLWTRVGPRKHKFIRIRQVAPMCPHGRAQWRHLANMIELSVFCGDAALCQITLTTCFSSFSIFFSDTIPCRQLKAKFHYASWFEARRRQIRSWSPTSFEPASVMEFGSKLATRQLCSEREIFRTGSHRVACVVSLSIASGGGQASVLSPVL